MGCETIKVKCKSIFIPDCIGASVYGKDRCTCNKKLQPKLNKKAQSLYCV